MARYQLTLAYDGSDFTGSQRQAKSRTVQGELEKALHKLGWQGRSVVMAGRTDTGVHAIGQVAAFDLNWSHADDELLRALNAELPADIAVNEAHVASNDFHPRFDASSRRYLYKLFVHPVRDPLRERYAWRIWPALDQNKLYEAAQYFMGSHDFSAFGSPTTPAGSTIRTVIRSEWAQTEDNEWRFQIQADAFLYRMVRRLVFVQAAFAQGKVSAETLARSLAKQGSAGRRSGLISGLAPAHGLTLIEVTYQESKGH